MVAIVVAPSCRDYCQLRDLGRRAMRVEWMRIKCRYALFHSNGCHHPWGHRIYRGPGSDAGRRRLLCGLGMLRISTLESTWIGVTVGVATACVNLGWAKLMVSILKWTAVLGGIPWVLMLGAIPVFLLLGILATGLLCGRLDRMRGECDPPYDPPALRPAGPTTRRPPIDDWTC